MKYYNILNDLEKLENSDDMFWNKNNQNSIEKLLAMAPKTLHYYLHKYNISIRENQKLEFINWLDKQDITEDTKVKDLLSNYPINTYEKAFISKLRKIYGIGFKEYKRLLGE